MQENTNKAIAINTIILYLRLGITAVCGLFTSKFALQALGVNDFGIFSVVGSVISFIAIINTIMVSTSNRFIAVAIGRGDMKETNEQFNVNLVIHAAIALLILIIAIPVGDWYIYHFVNYEGSIDSVVKVFNITVIGSVISFIGVPYNGLLMAKERFLVFCSVDVIVHIIKVVIVYLLIYHFTDKLLVYTITNTILAALPTIVFIVYCGVVFREIVRFNIVRDKAKYRSVFSFSVWIGYGALASIGKSQGSALIVNAFFNTAMNTALGLASTVNQLLNSFATNVSKSISPQIIKSYAAGNKERATELTCMSSKMAFMFMLMVSSPFLVTPHYIFELWLGQVPDFVILFTQLMVIDALVGTLNAGVPELVFATGNIKWYQIIVNTFFLLSVVAGYFVLKAGAPAYYIIVTYIVFSVIVLVIRQIVLNRVTHINNWLLIKKSYIPSVLVAVCYLPFVFFYPNLHPILVNIVSISYLLFLVMTIGMNSKERKYILNKIIKK